MILELKYTITKIKTQWISSAEKWREQRKESMNLKQQKLANLNNKEKID